VAAASSAPPETPAQAQIRPSRRVSYSTTLKPMPGAPNADYLLPA
jgi:hypothetical protein